MGAVEVKFNRMCRKKVPGGKRPICIEYSLVDKRGRLYEFSYISIDFKWMKPSINSHRNGTWVELHYDPEIDQYKLGDQMSIVYVDDLVLEMAKTIIAEHTLLLNLRL